jgi:hypothetical protein
MRRGADVARLASAVLVAAWLLPFAVTQVRQAIYPVLEEEDSRSTRWSIAPAAAPEMPPPAGEPVAAPPPAPVAEASVDVAAASSSARTQPVFSLRKAARAEAEGAVARRLQDIDPHVAIQTGPGVPSWRGQVHRLSWQGPVQASQEVRLVLLPPWAGSAWRIASVVLLAAALWLAVRGRWRWPRRGDGASRPAGPGLAPAASASALVLVLALAAGASWVPAPAHAAGRAPADEGGEPAPAANATLDPSPELLRQLLERLTEPAACAPTCAEVARLVVAARGSAIQLRLEVHAQADVALPLPGDGAGWHPLRASLGGQPATLRRDESGALRIAVPRGVSQVTIEADAGDASAIEIALPVPVRAVQSQLEGWTLGGLDARGLATGALSLTRTATPGRGAASPAAAADTLPPFVRVERALSLGLTWTATTTITRDGESRVPLRVRVPLVAGEAVNDASVQVDHGEAVVTLGAQASTSFASTIAIAPKLVLTSSSQASQVEVWSADVAPMWHAEFTGLAPMQADPRAAATRAWHPWPGESVSIALTRPAGAGGQTFTVDSLSTEVRPGLRATEASATLQVRASQGGNRRLTLPDGAELVSATLDGRPVTTQASAGVVTLALPPGAHAVQVAWREPRGIGLLFRTRTLAIEGGGVNAATTLSLSADRVVLAVGGPRMGPAVLFWGVVVVLGIVAVALARLRLAPLSAPAWFGLGLGLAPTSVGGAAIVAGWFFALAARRRVGPALPRAGFIALQLLLAAWTLLAASVLLDALRVGLLGYPDMMIAGNGSSADMLRWFVDRFQATPPAAWALSVPVLAYRLAMLLWALWMASALLKWVRWAWDCYSEGGHWRSKGAPPAPTPEPPAPGPVAPPPYTLGGDEEESEPA